MNEAREPYRRRAKLGYSLRISTKQKVCEKTEQIIIYVGQFVRSNAEPNVEEIGTGLNIQFNFLYIQDKGQSHH